MIWVPEAQIVIVNKLVYLAGVACQDVVMGADGKVTEVLAGKFAELLPHLDERQRRLYLGSEARALGGRGVAERRLACAAYGRVGPVDPAGSPRPGRRGRDQP